MVAALVGISRVAGCLYRCLSHSTKVKGGKQLEKAMIVAASLWSLNPRPRNMVTVVSVFSLCVCMFFLYELHQKNVYAAVWICFCQSYSYIYGCIVVYYLNYCICFWVVRVREKEGESECCSRWGGYLPRCSHAGDVLDQVPCPPEVEHVEHVERRDDQRDTKKWWLMMVNDMIIQYPILFAL